MKPKKIYRLIILCGLVFAMSACKKGLETSLPEFKVKDYEIKDQVDPKGIPFKEIVFNFEGSADVITFYSGEVGNEYDFKAGRKLEMSALYASFSSSVQSGTQPNQLSVLMSSDFGGVYTADGIHEASWTDITERFLLGTDNLLTPSMNADIYDLIGNEQQIHIAFRYTSLPGNGIFRIWRIQDFSLKGATNVGMIDMSSGTSADWTLINYGYITNNSMAVFESGDVIKFQGNNAALNIYTESWAVSKPFASKVIDRGPDWAKPIKSQIDPDMKKFSYIYAKPGAYRVTFVGKNINVNDKSQTVRHLNIVVPE